MAFAWDWMTLPGLVAGAVVLVLSVVVYTARRPGTSRALAFFLFLWGCQTALNTVAHLFTPGSKAYLAADALFWTALAAALLAYVPFIETLDSPVTRRPGPRSLAAYWSLGILALVAIVVDRQHFVVRGTGSRILSSMVAIAVLYGTVAAATAVRRARHTAAREKAKAYFMAALGHDLLLIPMAIWFGLGGPGADYAQETVVVLTIPPVAALWLATMLTYGMLRFHVFDIDLRIKRGLGRTAVLAALAAAFFTVSEVTEALLPIRGLWLGVAAAALVATASLPLERAATRCLDRLMPNVQDTDVYRSQRKEAVYEAALQELMADGRLTPGERKQLQTLRARLGLEPRPS